MADFTYPLLFVILFLLATLAVGLYFSGHRTISREYAVGDKKFTTATLVATVLATEFSGGGFQAYQHDQPYFIL